jgi:hypothetical protein
MTSTITRRSPNGLADAPVAGLSQEEWDVLRNSVCKGFSDTEAKVFAFRCQAMGLSPLTGQITAFKQGGGVVPIVTIDGYRSIAASIDPGYVVEIEYLSEDGWVDWIPNGEVSQARAKVWRTGTERPVVKAVSRKEFAGNGGPWKSMPNHMLAKVAESHALRMAYPQGLAGTYSSDEVSTAQPAVVTEITPPTDAPAAKKKLKPQAAPPTVNQQQLQTMANAMNAVLDDVGREAFLSQLCTAFEITALNELPAEQFDAVMRMLAMPKRVQLWNEGKDGNGDLIVSEERIAELRQLGDVDQAELIEGEFLEDAEAG